ncbi:hypothetical protein ABW19_dt0206694 [Dactylella cylindrospora]|nr:hypothetical protein ABW19_dt0206694 [Dactylella cylindrospora]
MKKYMQRLPCVRMRMPLPSLPTCTLSPYFSVSGRDGVGSEPTTPLPLPPCLGHMPHHVFRSSPSHAAVDPPLKWLCSCFKLLSLTPLYNLLSLYAVPIRLDILLKQLPFLMSKFVESFRLEILCRFVITRSPS